MSNKVAQDALEIVAVVMDNCTVERGAGTVSDPGVASTTVNVESAFPDKNTLVYTIETDTSLLDGQSAPIANIRVTYVAIYHLKADVKLTDAQLDLYGSVSAVPHVIPFIREFLASITNRMGIPPFFLPIVRPSSAIDSSDAAATGSPQRRRTRKSTSA